MDQRPHLRAGATAVCAVAAMAAAAGCSPRPPARPAARPAAAAAPPVLEPEYVLDVERIQQLQTLRNDSTATVTIVLPLPALAGSASFTFTRVERPVSADRLTNVLFARGESEDPPRQARITLTSTNDVRLTIFDDTAVYIARMSPNTPFRYRLLTGSKDAAGHICSVSRRENEPALRRLSLSASAVDSAPPRRLQIVIAVGPMMGDEYDGDDATLEIDVTDMLSAANEILTRDVGVTLVLSGTVLRASTTDLPGPDLLANIQTFIQNAVTTHGWPMDLGHMIEEDGGGRSDIGGFCTPGRSAKGWSGSSDAFIEPVLLNFAHEVGHQLGAAHTYNITDGYRDPPNAYEPGKGISIMSIGDDIGPYYHANSMALLDQSLHNRTPATGCGAASADTGSAPLVRVGVADPHVPRDTPFEVEALPDMASKAYRWDEYDLAPRADAAPPFFDSSSERSLTRIYPPLAQLLDGPSSPSPVWPRGALKFRLLGFRGVAHKHKDITVHVDNNGPFAITAVTCPAGPCAPGGSIDVTWRVASTNASPYRVSALRIEVVEEAGRHRRRLIASGLPNTGHVTLPIPTSVPSPITVRLMLHAERGIFFALSDQIAIR